MSDPKKVISWLRPALDTDDCLIELPYNVVKAIYELLKEQEPVKPYLDYDGSDAWRVWRCVACGASLFHHVEDNSEEGMKNYVRYCKHCGRALNWDDDSKRDVDE